MAFTDDQVYVAAKSFLAAARRIAAARNGVTMIPTWEGLDVVSRTSFLACTRVALNATDPKVVAETMARERPNG